MADFTVGRELEVSLGVAQGKSRAGSPDQGSGRIRRLPCIGV